MIDIIKFALIFGICVFIGFLLNKDYRKGFSVSIFLLILLPGELFIEIGGGLPTITVFRAIILVLLFFSISKGKFKIKWKEMSILNLLFIILLIKLFSLLFAFNFATSFNGFIKFAIETFLFYIILLKGIESRANLDNILFSISAAILLIAVVGFIERYTQFNPVDLLALPGDARLDPRLRGDICSLLRHPIHFGIALAMGWPICIYMLDKQKNFAKKYLFSISIFLIYAGLYFSNSRGPWLGFIITVIIFVIFRYPRIKFKIVPILYLTILLLIVRPGIFDSIQGLTADTIDPTKLEGGSFYYRFEILKVAYYEVIKEPIRFAFGYGLGSAQSMNIFGNLSYGSGREVRFWSWDNEFAAILLQEGFVGLILSLILYFYIMIFLFKMIKSIGEKDRSLIIVLLASIAVFVFMLTNVAIYSPQLRFLLWTNVAIGVILSKEKTTPSPRDELSPAIRQKNV